MGELLVVPVYVTEEDFISVLGRRFPIAVGDFGFNAFIDHSVITAGTVDSTLEALEGLETDLNKVYPRTLVLSRLGLSLEEFKRDLTLARVPVYVFVSLLFIVVLYFLALVGGILSRSHSEELGMLRSRGANVAQICGVWLLTEGALALVFVAVGPLLALLVVRYLLLPTFGELSGGPLVVDISGDMYVMAAVGALFSMLVLAVAMAGRARADLADTLSSRSRPPTLSFFHRYYLDLVTVLVVGLLWWQLRERDGFVSSAIAGGGLDVDPLLVLGPVLGLLATSLLLMRGLPLIVRLVGWLCTRAGPGWSSFTLIRVARDPVLPSSLSVLLMLAAALGVFGATFQSSLSRSQSDQASYRIGGDVRVYGSGLSPAMVESLEEIPGVAAATPVLRQSVSLAEGHRTVPALLIAAEPEALARSAWFRDDFARHSTDTGGTGKAGLPELAARVKTASVPRPSTGSGGEISGYGVPLPQGAQRLGVWLEPGTLANQELQADISVWVRLVDSSGRFRNVSLGGFGGLSGEAQPGWRFYSGELPEGVTASQRSWSLAALFLSTSSLTKVGPGQVYLDDITAFGPRLPQEGVLLEGFEQGSEDMRRTWLPLGISGGAPDSLEISSLGARTGSAGTTFSWEEPMGGAQRGIHLSPVPLPIPALGGPGLSPGQTLSISQGLASIPVVVVGVTELFPTVTSFRRPFLVIDIDAYLSYLKVLPPISANNSPREVWLSIDPVHDRETVIADITSVLPVLSGVDDRQEAAEYASRNPLAGGGWDGLTAMAIVGIGLAVVAALSLHSAASARASRVDTAVGRALGLSRLQLFLSLAAERWLTGLVAIAVGAAIGYWPGIQLVQLLDLTPRGGSAIPPMIPSVHVLLLAAVLAGLTFAVMASAFFSSFISGKDSPVDVLREAS